MDSIPLFLLSLYGALIVRHYIREYQQFKRDRCFQKWHGRVEK
jgi:hypothetical protein